MNCCVPAREPFNDRSASTPLHPGGLVFLPLFWLGLIVAVWFPPPTPNLSVDEVARHVFSETGADSDRGADPYLRDSPAGPGDGAALTHQIRRSVGATSPLATAQSLVAACLILGSSSSPPDDLQAGAFRLAEAGLGPTLLPHRPAYVIGARSHCDCPDADLRCGYPADRRPNHLFPDGPPTCASGGHGCGRWLVLRVHPHWTTRLERSDRLLASGRRILRVDADDERNDVARQPDQPRAGHNGSRLDIEQAGPRSGIL